MRWPWVRRSKIGRVLRTYRDEYQRLLHKDATTTNPIQDAYWQGVIDAFGSAALIAAGLANSRNTEGDENG